MTRRVHEDWSAIVQELSLDLSKPVSYVTSRQVKGITGKEPRIMAKMDSSASLPGVFREHGVFVLPVTNRKYAIVRGQGYHEPEPIESTTRTFPSTFPFEVISPTVGRSEMQFVDLAYNSGLIEHFIGAGSLYLLVRGRKYSPPFDFRVGPSPALHVEGVQVEIDGGFEGESVFVTLEAKVDHRGDFIVRQLYYPYRFWDETLRSRDAVKEVRPVFLVYDSRASTYSIWEYRFRDPANYESIELVRSARFNLEWKRLDIRRFEAIQPEESGARRRTVPQADDVAKIGEMPFLAWLEIDDARKVAAHFDFDPRQSSYYSQAAEALGLIELRGNRYRLTELGLEYIRRSAPERNETLCKLMLKLPLFNEALALMLLDEDRVLRKSQIMDLIRNRGYTGSTVGRRARTILAWFEWMERTFGLVGVQRDRVSLISRQTRLDT